MGFSSMIMAKRDELSSLQSLAKDTVSNLGSLYKKFSDDENGIGSILSIDKLDSFLQNPLSALSSIADSISNVSFPSIEDISGFIPDGVDLSSLSIENAPEIIEDILDEMEEYE